MKLIVGLGNPGKEYENTRHNAGFLAIDSMIRTLGFDALKIDKKHKAEITQGEIAGEKVIVAKPQTFMNLSGESVQSLLSFYKMTPEDLIVIYDDNDIEQGTVRIRGEGSAGGHNGIKSIIGQIGPRFMRVRLGIKPLKPFPGALEGYVLGKWTSGERELLDQNLVLLPDIIETLITHGLEKAMADFN